MFYLLHSLELTALLSGFSFCDLLDITSVRGLLFFLIPRDKFSIDFRQPSSSVTLFVDAKPLWKAFGIVTTRIDVYRRNLPLSIFNRNQNKQVIDYFACSVIN